MLNRRAGGARTSLVLDAAVSTFKGDVYVAVDDTCQRSPDCG